ncbi:MAG TPA: ROK family protein [Vicinamibacterales bacterium]|nr:ROK family protein [Vicinamibacterales bacterium]
MAAAAAGDAIAETTLTRYEHRMARALAGVINVLDPEVIVLGGGMSNIERLYQNVPRLWNAFVFDASEPLGVESLAFDYRPGHPEHRGGVGVGSGGRLRTRLVRAAHGDASGVRGAAWLWSV